MSPTKKTRYRTTDWKQYNAALKARGSLSIWMDKRMTWFAAGSGKRGRSPKFSNAALAGCRRLGRSIWKRWIGYHRRSLVETKMNCIKCLGEQVMSRTFERQVNEWHIRVAILIDLLNWAVLRQQPWHSHGRGLG